VKRERRCAGRQANDSACAALHSIHARDTSPSKPVEVYASVDDTTRTPLTFVSNWMALRR